ARLALSGAGGGARGNSHRRAAEDARRLTESLHSSFSVTLRRGLRVGPFVASTRCSRYGLICSSASRIAWLEIRSRPSQGISISTRKSKEAASVTAGFAGAL